MRGTGSGWTNSALLLGDLPVIPHSGLSGLSTDDHTIYLFLAGRTTGQIANGGLNAAGTFTLSSTAHATKGFIYLGTSATKAGYDEVNERLGIGISAPAAKLQVVGSSNIIQFRVRGFSTQTSAIVRIDNSSSTALLTLSNVAVLTLGGTGLQGRLSITTDAATTISTIEIAHVSTVSAGIPLGDLKVVTNLNNNASGVGPTTCIFLFAAIDNATISVTGFQGSASFGAFPGSLPSGYGLLFSVATEGSEDFFDIFGARIVAEQAPIATGAITGRLGGIDLVVTTGSGSGLVAEALGIDIDQFYDGDVTVSYGARIKSPTISSTIGTLYGIYLGDQVGATTNWAIYSLGGDSSHLGKFMFGANTAPTAGVHVKGGGSGFSNCRIESQTAPSSLNSGDLWHDSTRKSLQCYTNSVIETLPSILFSATADATVASTGTETTILGSGIGTKTLPANFLVAGKTIRLLAKGRFSTAVVPDTFNIRFKLGSTTIVSTGVRTPAGTVTDEGWAVEVLLTCRTTGGSGTVIAQGEFRHGDDTTSADYNWYMIATGTTTIDTTTSQAIDLTIDYTTGSASDSITCTSVTLGVLN